MHTRLDKALARSRSHNEIVELSWDSDTIAISGLLRYYVGNAWDCVQLERSPVVWDYWSTSATDSWRLTVVIRGT